MVTEFTVRGSFSAFRPPERGTVRATLGLEGPQMQPVYDRAVRDLEAVKASIEPLHDPNNGPVTWWSTQHVRTWAVQDAAARAQEYADALDLGQVRPVAVADAGMLGDGLQPSGFAEAAFVRGGNGPQGGDLALSPEDIEVSATVDARFVAG